VKTARFAALSGQAMTVPSIAHTSSPYQCTLVVAIRNRTVRTLVL